MTAELPKLRRVAAPVASPTVLEKGVGAMIAGGTRYVGSDAHDRTDLDAHARRRPKNAVLIAAGEPGLQHLLVATIASDDALVVVAAGGDEAWWLVRQWQPAVVLVGVELQGLSGAELTRRIKREPFLAETTVVFLPEYGREPDIAAGIAAGADHCLSRPFSPLELLRIVDQTLRRATRAAKSSPVQFRGDPRWG